MVAGLRASAVGYTWRYLIHASELPAGGGRVSLGSLAGWLPGWLRGLPGQLAGGLARWLLGSQAVPSWGPDAQVGM